MSIRRNILIFKLLSHFEVVVEHRQLKSAAEYLGLKQSNLSREIRDLEEIVGTKLLIRNSHGFTPTFAGEKLYRMTLECGEKMLKITDSFHNEACKGNITVKFPTFCITAFQKYHLNRFHDLYPEITCKIFDGDILTPCELKDVDVCSSFVKIDSPNVDIICSGQMRYSLVCTKKYIEKYDFPKNLNDLYENHHMCMSDEYIKNMHNHCHFEQYKHLDFIVPTLEMLLSLVNDNQVISVMPSFLMHSFPNLVEVKIEDLNCYLQIWLMTYSNRSKIPYVHSMTDFIIDFYRTIQKYGYFQNLELSPDYTQNSILENIEKH